MMFKSILSISIVCSFVLFSCKGKNTNDSEGNSAADGTFSNNPAGTYEGVLPCADCTGIRTALEIKGDSSYIIRETKMIAGQAPNLLSHAGKITYMADGKILELSGREEGSPRFFQFNNEGGLNVASDNDIATQDSAAIGSLTRMTRLISEGSKVDVFEYAQEFKKYPARVFHRIQHGDITIDKNYLAAAPDAEKAIVAYYAIVFKAGCEDNACVLMDALGGEEKAMALAKKYLSNDYTIKPDLEKGAGAATEELEMLIIFNGNGKLRAQIATFDDKNKLVNRVDEFKLSDENLVRIKSEVADPSRLRSVDNPSARGKGPTDEKERQKIIDSKKPAGSTQNTPVKK